MAAAAAAAGRFFVAQGTSAVRGFIVMDIESPRIVIWGNVVLSTGAFPNAHTQYNETHLAQLGIPSAQAMKSMQQGRLQPVVLFELEVTVAFGLDNEVTEVYTNLSTFDHELAPQRFYGDSAHTECVLRSADGTAIQLADYYRAPGLLANVAHLDLNMPVADPDQHPIAMRFSRLVEENSIDLSEWWMPADLAAAGWVLIQRIPVEKAASRPLPMLREKEVAACVLPTPSVVVDNGEYFRCAYARESNKLVNAKEDEAAQGLCGLLNSKDEVSQQAPRASKRSRQQPKAVAS